MRAVSAYGALGLVALAASLLCMYIRRSNSVSRLGVKGVWGTVTALPALCMRGATDFMRPTSSRLGNEYELTARQLAASSDRLFWNNIQVLRLIAAYGIVYVHLELIFAALDFGTSVVEILRFGTDLFLVVSGFLAAHVLAQSGKTAGVFLRDRAIRILPLYWLFTLLAFFTKNVATSYGAPTMRELGMSLVFIPYGPYPILHPTWSLVVIVEFSLIIAAFQTVSAKHGVYLASVFVVLLVLFGQAFPSDNPAFIAYTNPILINFAFGVLIYKLISVRAAALFPGRQGLAVGAAIIVVSAATVLARPFLWPDMPRLAALGVPASGLLLGTVFLEKAGYLVRSVSVNFVARSTYAIYLCHQFVNGASEKIVALQPSLRDLPILALLVNPFIVTVVAVFVFAYVEAPMTRFLKERIS